MKTYAGLDRLLEYLERNINPERIELARIRSHKAIAFEPVDIVPLSVWVSESDLFSPVPRDQTYNSPELMLYNELLYSFGSALNGVMIQDDSLYQVRSNHGVGIIASLFGANCRIVNDMPWVDHVEKTLLSMTLERGAPCLQDGLGRQVFETYEYFNERLKAYPACYANIHISQPDLQGPFDIAHLLMGPDIFYELYDDPEWVHFLMEAVTETYIAFAKQVEPLLTCNLKNDSLVVHGSLYGGRSVVKDDTAAINLSKEFYQEFSSTYNYKIYEALGGASLHHCGQERSWHFDSFVHPKLKGLNFGQPQFHSLDSKLENSQKYRIPLIGWNHDLPWDGLPMQDFYRLMPKTGITLTCTAKNVDEARKIYDTHQRLCSKGKEC